MLIIIDWHDLCRIYLTVLMMNDVQFIVWGWTECNKTLLDVCLCRSRWPSRRTVFWFIPPETGPRSLMAAGCRPEDTSWPWYEHLLYLLTRDTFYIICATPCCLWSSPRRPRLPTACWPSTWLLKRTVSLRTTTATPGRTASRLTCKGGDPVDR